MSNEYHSNRNAAHRYLVIKVDDSGTENYLDLEGIEGHKPTKVLHVQPHGFTSVPVKDAHLLGVRLGHMDDLLVALGGEHSDHKPKDLGAGNTALYNADGTIMKMIGKDATFVHKGTYTHECKEFVVKCGEFKITINKDGMAISKGKVTHNKINIGDTHKHGNGGGIGNSGTPR